MKLLAIFQIMLLPATCAVPEGRHLLVRTSGCGCSEEARQTGTCCCCADKCGSEANEPNKQKPATANSCCRRNHSSASSRNSRPSQPATCCSTRRQTTDEAAADQQISACPCGGEVYELTVMMMPRVQPRQVRPTSCADIPTACWLQNEHGTVGRPAPESPPPQNCPC